MEAAGERRAPLTKNKYNPTSGLSQFIVGIYAYWRDKGMSIHASKKRMYASTYEAIDNIGSEEDIGLNYEESTKYMQHLINRYGAQISKKDNADITDEELEILKELKQLKDVLGPIVQRMKEQ